MRTLYQKSSFWSSSISFPVCLTLPRSSNHRFGAKQSSPKYQKSTGRDDCLWLQSVMLLSLRPSPLGSSGQAWLRQRSPRSVVINQRELEQGKGSPGTHWHVSLHLDIAWRLHHSFSLYGCGRRESCESRVFWYIKGLSVWGSPIPQALDVLWSVGMCADERHVREVVNLCGFKWRYSHMAKHSWKMVWVLAGNISRSLISCPHTWLFVWVSVRVDQVCLLPLALTKDIRFKSEGEKTMLVKNITVTLLLGEDSIYIIITDCTT